MSASAAHRDFAALQWVAGDIEKTAEQTVKELLGFADNLSDQTRLRFALTQSHQLHATLRLLDVPSAEHLAREIEDTLQGILHGDIEATDTLLQQLLSATLQLPGYLKRIASDRRESPAEVAPLINELRRTRGEAPLEFSGAVQEIDVSELQQGSGPEAAQATDEELQLLRRSRQRFQNELVGLLRGEAPLEKLRNLRRVFALLAEQTRPGGHRLFWEAAQATCEGLLEGGVELDEAANEAIRDLDSELRADLALEHRFYSRVPDAGLYRRLLELIAPSRPVSTLLAEIQQRHHLLPAVRAAGRPLDDLGAVGAAAEVLGAELRAVLDRLEGTEGDAFSVARVLREVEPELRKITSTLNGLGYRHEHEILALQLGRADALTLEGEDLEERLTEISAALLEVDQRLATRALEAGGDASQVELRRHPLQRARVSVFREVQAGLEQIKQVVSDYLTTDRDVAMLGAMEKDFHALGGALRLAGLESADALLSQCRRYVRELSSGTLAAPDAEDIDRFADVISSVEYFIERLGVDSVPAELVLARAASSLHGLLKAASAPRPAEIEAPRTEPQETAQVGLPEQETVPSEAAEPETGTTEAVEAAPAEAEIGTTEPVEAAPAEAEIGTTEPVEEAPVDAETATAEATMVVEAAEVDPEIAEIFVEEVAEVLGNIDTHFSRWQQAPVPGESLSEIRRAFHTLKGSGRMVGAGIVGELAWSIENLLNRVIDATVTVSPAVIEAVDQARKMIPGLVEAFAKAAPVNLSTVNVVQEAAHALARNEAVELPVAGAAAAAARVAAPVPELEVPAPELEAEELAEPVAEAEVTEPSEAAAEELEAGPFVPEREGEEPSEPAAVTELEAEDWLPELEPEELARAQELEEAAAEHDATAEAAAEPAAPESVEDWLPELEREELAVEGAEPAAEGVEAEPEAEDWLPELEPEELARAQALEGLPQEAAQPEPEEAEPQEVEAAHPEPEPEETAWAARVAEEEVEPSRPETPLPFDSRLLAIFREEMGNHLRQLRDFLHSGGVVGEPQTRALHTLRGSAHVAGAKVIGMAADRVDEVLRAAALAGRALEVPEAGLLRKFTELLEQAVAAEDPNGAALQAVAHALGEEAAEIAAAAAEAAGAAGEPGIAARVTRFLEDALERLFHASKLAEAWTAGEAGMQERRQLLEELEGIHQRAAQIELQSIVALSAPLLEASSAAARGEEEATESLFELLRRGLDALMDLLDCLAAGQLAPAPAVLIGELQNYCASRETAEAPAAEPQVPEAPALEAVRGRIVRELAQSEPELLDVFMDEAEELMAGIDEAIEAWRHDRANREYFDTLQRQLHTLKGGARMAGLKFLGDLSHNFETLVINQDLHFGSFDDAFFARVGDLHEQLLRAMDVVRARPALEEAAAAAATEEAPPAEPVPQPAPVAAPEAERAPEPLGPLAEIPAPPREVAVPGTTVSVVAARLPLAPTPEKPAARPRDEVVRVSAQLLEELVNLAGETSISRARVEEQVSELGFLFDEMQSTLERLQNQVRRLDIATEAQILFRRERAEHSGHEGFDPLEMDRYSQLQQLARSLVESSSDLLDIKRTLAEKTGDVETVLVQQARINSQLQEGLMRSRMVPFANILPRLRRVVRQVSAELGKQVELELGNVAGELDRGILERIVAPLEHMLRNAVDHGVESIEKRRESGKPEVGRIELQVAREGGEVVISLADDGAGVDLEAVRRLALERGLIAPEVQASDRDLMQLILHSGFSTAQKVTQISGRGVGLDVVNSEIRQMGGSLEIQTEPGKGSRFVVRLPFTVSVSRALMVGVAGETYAIPLNTVQGVVRIRRDDRSSQGDPNAAILQYAGDQYRVRHLGSLLFPGEHFDASDLEDTIPVVLVRGGGQALAVEVDRLVGAREIVVKSLGPQFGAVSGLSGATVLGDGSVVVILDIPAMLRADYSLGPPVAAPQPVPAPAVQGERAKRAPLIMVVDDSVTVRKVTTRFLEREGLRVVTAKDGAEAMVKLQEYTPDLMLLDIEMPHMDGFEVISKVRLSERFRALPIIMITSRTGEKHRERALSLGANDYMGKPYQEAVLLKSINDLLHRDED